MSAVDELKPIPHLICDDPWYSCPASGECSNDGAGDECSCGADYHNAQIRAAIAELEAEVERINRDRLHLVNQNGPYWKQRTESVESELRTAQWAITQWHAEEDDWIRDRAALTAALNRANAATTREEAKLAVALAEVTRLHDICDRLAEAGHRGDGT